MREVAGILDKSRLAARWRDDSSAARELPFCSIRDCENAAGAVIEGALLCGEHANEVFSRRQRRAIGR